ncbi:DUF1552 domain-containing protein [Sandaracinus amylolyticus]|uniref:DUF1552 domain-containing protein n=1 Tax=Sandaracinus amylolyticus TaxID=927083 RepID=UPI001F2AEE2C|nr:DUF1552 domain-containing protein [Sandaracinus amylolyticus]UJR79428.1 Transcriptional initiation protein Tat [Sandaracinus amylolyticus]
MRINRRKFLVGAAGATVALPALESWFGNRAMAGGEDRARFAVFVRAGNGVAQQWNDEPEQFWPRATGAITAATLRDQNADRATTELADYAPRLNLLKGIHRPFSTPTCGHSDSIVQCLTAAQINAGAGNAAQARGESADWRIARAMNPSGREPLTLMAGPGSAYIAEGLSWSAAGVRTSAERSPLNAYMRMMGLSSAPPEIQVRIAERRMSVNDLVRDQMQSVLGRTDISARDRRRLQQHFDAIRDTEIRMSCDLDESLVDAISAIDNPQANDVRPDVVRRHMDLVAFAFSCDINRAATIQVGEGNDQTQYEIGGSRLPRFHWISHRIYSDGSDGETIPNAVTLHHQVDRLHLQMFKYLLDRLDAYPSAYGGTLLDDSVAVWLNDLGNGPPHSGDKVPWLLAGSAGGFLRTGQYLDLGRVTINRVLNTIISAVGVRKDDGSLVDDFGDSSLTGGLIDQIVAT